MAATFDRAVLYLGGTGTISASCVRRSVAAGQSVYVLNRGRKVADIATAETDNDSVVGWITGAKCGL